MTVKIKNSGSYISKINGKQLINNQYALDINSDRKKSKQVLGMFNNNGHIERMHDSLQNYMNKMSSKNQSIFDVLKQEHNNLNNIPNVSSVPNASSVPLGVIKKMKALKTRKMRDHSGISSKLFDFSPVIPLVSANANANALTRKKKRKKASRRARRNPKL
jgi:hypothetical protein